MNDKILEDLVRLVVRTVEDYAIKHRLARCEATGAIHSAYIGLAVTPFIKRKLTKDEMDVFDSHLTSINQSVLDLIDYVIDRDTEAKTCNHT